MAAGQCQAGPWVIEAGEAYGRGAIAFETVEGLQARRHDFYGEVGLGRGFALTTKAEQVIFPDARDFDADGYRITVRKRVWDRDTFHVALEGGAVYGAAIGGVRGCDRLGGEARASAGVSGQWYGSDWYLFGDVATRVHAEGCWRQRLELGGGQEVARNLFVTNQVWIEGGSEQSRSVKVETGLLYRLSRADISLAWREEVSGRFEESGLVVSLAARF